MKDKKIPLKLDLSFSLFRLIERLVFVIGIIFLFNLITNKNEEVAEAASLLKAKNDTIQKWKTIDGKHMAKIAVLESENSNSLLALESTNQTVNELKDLVKSNRKLLKKQGSASIVKAETIIESEVKTEIEKTTKGLVYRGRDFNKWYEISSIANPEYTRYSVKTLSELNLTIGLEKQGFLKKKKPFAIANDKNPYTNIKDMRTYQVSLPKKSKWGVGFYGGYGISSNNQQLNLGWQIGIGANYTLIKL